MRDLLLVALLAVIELPAGLSLCIAADGHATIELAHAATPCTSDFARHHPDAAMAGRHLGEHPCRDVPLLEASARRDAPSSGLAAAPGGAALRPLAAAGSGGAPLSVAARVGLSRGDGASRIGTVLLI